MFMLQNFYTRMGEVSAVIASYWCMNRELRMQVVDWYYLGRVLGSFARKRRVSRNTSGY